MAEEEVELEESAESDEGGGAKSGGKKMMILGAVALLVVGGGGFVAYRALAPQPEVQAAEEEGSEDDAEGEEGVDESSSGSAALLESAAIVSLDPILVNLADEEKKRFVRLRIELVFDSQAEMEKVKESEFAIAKAKHVSLSLIGTKRSSEIGDLEGQDALREELRKALRKNIRGVDIVEVLLTEFIIQY